MLQQGRHKKPGSWTSTDTVQWVHSAGTILPFSPKPNVLEIPFPGL